MEKKNENHHHILHIPIDLGSKFRLQRIFQNKKEISGGKQKNGTSSLNTSY